MTRLERIKTAGEKDSLLWDDIEALIAVAEAAKTWWDGTPSAADDDALGQAIAKLEEDVE